MKLAFSTLLLVLVPTMLVSAQERQNELLTSAAMKKKLEYSQNILEGLATEDFELIRKNAEAMQKLSRLEAFVRYSDRQAYGTQLQVFDFSNTELIRLAEEKNIDGAALAFTQTTLSCVNCHKAIRAKAEAN